MTNQNHVIVKPSNCLTNSTLDSWLIGGLSLALYIPLIINETTIISDVPPFARHISFIAPTFTLLSLVVNFPHFMWSYKLAYTQSFSFVRRNWFQLIFIPLFMISLFSLAFFNWSNSVDQMQSSKVIAAIAGVIGANKSALDYKNFGGQILGTLLVFQFAIVGWHYVKQTYGVMMAYSHYTEYKLSNLQRTILRWTLFGIWWVFFLKSNTGAKSSNTWGVVYNSLDLPSYLTYIGQTYVALSLIATLYFVFYSNWQKRKVSPPIQVLIPFISIYIWFTPWDLLFVPAYFTYIVPFAHSLQYLGFVYKVENVSLRKHSTKVANLRGLFLILTILLIGFLVIEVIPPTLDKYAHSLGYMTAGFFFASFQIFINIHHYFIDNAIWQSKNSEIKGLLFK